MTICPSVCGSRPTTVKASTWQGVKCIHVAGCESTGHPRGRWSRRCINVVSMGRKPPSPITIATLHPRSLPTSSNHTIATMTNSNAVRSIRWRLHPSFRSVFLLSICIILILPVQAQNNYCSHDGGLWGTLKASIVPIGQPVQDSLCKEYNKLSDTGRFLAGACVGFGASKVVIGGKHVLYV